MAIETAEDISAKTLANIREAVKKATGEDIERVWSEPPVDVQSLKGLVDNDLARFRPNEQVPSRIQRRSGVK